MVAGPLEPKLVAALEAGAVDHSKLEATLRRDFGYDLLAARNVWAFGPSPSHGPNALLDETFVDDKPKQLYVCREAITQGFSWACREGVLCDEPVRGVKFKLLDAELDSSPLHRGAGQVIPTARKACYAAMLTAQPRLLEPVLLVDCIAKASATNACRKLVTARRGRMLSERKVPGTALVRLQAEVPALDAYGLETDLRLHSHGDAFCLQTFSHWDVVPGDPMDESIVLRPLEACPPEHLARELVVKVRRRKGLPDNLSLSNYFDDKLMLEIAKREAEAVVSWGN
jgi:U5 small nuclear ribonucleoprotein component